MGYRMVVYTYIFPLIQGISWNPCENHDFFNGDNTFDRGVEPRYVGKVVVWHLGRHDARLFTGWMGEGDSGDFPGSGGADGSLRGWKLLVFQDFPGLLAYKTMEQPMVGNEIYLKKMMQGGKRCTSKESHSSQYLLHI